jgi:hypothetical protein
MIRKASLILGVWLLVWFGVVEPCRLLAVDLLFWRAAFIREEMVSLVLLIAQTIGGLLAWIWTLRKARGCRNGGNP